MSAVYLIDGKPHRLCDCSRDTPHCPRGSKRNCQTAGYNQCLVPAPDVILIGFSESNGEAVRALGSIDQRDSKGKA